MSTRIKTRRGTFFLCCLLAASTHAGTPADNVTRKSREWFQTDAGQKTLNNILSWQSVHGDWPKNTDTTKKPYSGDRSKLRGTFDNGATTGELRALAHAFRMTEEPTYEKSFLAGFDHILKAQYANGGWPQSYPLRKGYSTHITFNDNCMIRLMEFLTDASTSDDYAFLNEGRRSAATSAVNRGIDCIVKCQVIVDGVPTVWCAQHDEVTFAEASARSYELASLSGGESASILKYLMTLETPTPEVIRCVKAGCAWFKRSKLEGYSYNRINDTRVLTKDPAAKPLWARFYEVQTNRPFFCDRDGIVKYDVAQISSERRNGYSWYGNWGESLANAFAKWPHRESADR